MKKILVAGLLLGSAFSVFAKTGWVTNLNWPDTPKNAKTCQEMTVLAAIGLVKGGCSADDVTKILDIGIDLCMTDAPPRLAIGSFEATVEQCVSQQAEIKNKLTELCDASEQCQVSLD